MSFDDAAHLVTLNAKVPDDSSDARLVAAIHGPVLAHLQAQHDAAVKINVEAAAPQPPPASARKALTEAHMRTNSSLSADDAAAKAQRDLEAATSHRANQHAELVAGLPAWITNPGGGRGGGLPAWITDPGGKGAA